MLKLLVAWLLVAWVLPGDAIDNLMYVGVALVTLVAVTHFILDAIFERVAHRDIALLSVIATLDDDEEYIEDGAGHEIKPGGFNV